MIEALCRGLEDSYTIDSVTNGSDGLHYADVNSYDAILLDLNLPDINGAKLCKDLRKENNMTPIIVLTGLVDVGNKVNLLDIGADDYLTKPFSMEELRARLRSQIRKHHKSGNDSKLIIDDLVLDTSSRAVYRQQTPISLRRKEFDLLEYLIHNKGKVVTRAMIIDHVWDIDDQLWTNAIDVHIKYLRDKVDRPFNSNLIKTVHGVGYKIDSFHS